MKYEKATAEIISFGPALFMAMSANAQGGVYCENYGSGHCAPVWTYNEYNGTWIQHSSGNWVSDSSVDPSKGHWVFF